MKRLASCAIAVSLGAVALSGSAQAEILKQTDFINVGMEQFDVYDVGPDINPTFIRDGASQSNWFISGGALHQQSNIWGHPDPADRETNPYTGTQAVVKDFEGQDGAFFMQFTTSDDDIIGLVFRFQDKRNFMRFISMCGTGNGGPVSRIDKWVDGEWETLAITDDPDLTYRQNVRDTLLVVADGPEIRAYVGDLTEPVLTATDPSPAPGRFGVHLYAQDSLDIHRLVAVSPDSGLYVAELNDPAGNPINNQWARLIDANGQAVAGTFTNPMGQALFVDVAPGNYTLSISGLTLQPVDPIPVTVEATGLTSGSFMLDLQSTPTLADLSTGAGHSWQILIPADPDNPTERPTEGPTEAAELNGYEPYFAPEDIDVLYPDNPVYFWLKTEVNVPAGSVGKDLVLTGYNLDDQDWTYWNGQLIGHNATYNAIRSYVIPGELVQANNTLMVLGLDTGGGGGMTISAPILVTANPSVQITGQVADRDGNPIPGVTVEAFDPLTDWGPQSGSNATDEQGIYRIGGMAPGHYTIVRKARIDLDPAADEQAQQTGEGGQTLTQNFTVTVRPSTTLSSANGMEWQVLYDTAPGDDYSAVNANTSGFEEVTVPGALEDFFLGMDLSLFWYRLEFNLPQAFAQYQGRDLIVTGFNVDDADITYFNGQQIGSTGTLPTDPLDPTNTGYAGNAGGIRTYTIPAAAVNWTGTNVLTIQGYENTGSSGITVSAPQLIVGPGETTPVTPGDLNDDGAVTVTDATLALRFAVGLATPTAEQVAAGDLNDDGALTIADATRILRIAVGLE